MTKRDYTLLSSALRKDSEYLERLFVEAGSQHASENLSLHTLKLKELLVIARHFKRFNFIPYVKLSSTKGEIVCGLARFFKEAEAISKLKCCLCSNLALVGKTVCINHDDSDIPGDYSNSKVYKMSSAKIVSRPNPSPLSADGCNARITVNTSNLKNTSAESHRRSSAMDLKSRCRQKVPSRKRKKPSRSKKSSSSPKDRSSHGSSPYSYLSYDVSSSTVPCSFHFRETQVPPACKSAETFADGPPNFIMYERLSENHNFEDMPKSNSPFQTFHDNSVHDVANSSFQGVTSENMDMEQIWLQEAIALSSQVNSTNSTSRIVTAPDGTSSQPYSSTNDRCDTETKEEPFGWQEMLPLQKNEAGDIERFKKYGFSKVKILKTLRACDNDLQKTAKKLFEAFRDIQEAQLIDQAALQSEKSGEEENARRKRDEQVELEYGDILASGKFEGSILRAKIKNHEFDKLIDCEKLIDGSIVINVDDEYDESALLRTSCIRLLVLEKSALRWYREDAARLFDSISMSFNKRLHGKHPINHEFVQSMINTVEKALYSFPNKDGSHITDIKPDSFKYDDEVEIVPSFPDGSGELVTWKQLE